MLYLSAFSISLNQIKSPRNPSFSSHLPPLPPECTQPPNKFPFLGNGCACRPVAWLQGDLLVPPSGSAQGLEKCGSPFSLESLTDVLDVMSNHHGRAQARHPISVSSLPRGERGPPLPTTLWYWLCVPFPSIQLSLVTGLALTSQPAVLRMDPQCVCVPQSLFWKISKCLREPGRQLQWGSCCHWLELLYMGSVFGLGFLTIQGLRFKGKCLQRVRRSSVSLMT